jgi:hypothetical protein
MHKPLALFTLLSITLIPALAAAQESVPSAVQEPAPSATPIRDSLSKPTFLAADEAAQGQARTKAYVYSDAYQTRAKIHKYASFATLPLFAAEAVIGQKLYNNPTSQSLKSEHLAIAAAMGGLFAVNTVTGVWNLVEGRENPKGRTKRTVHGILMLLADVGFLATAATGPGSHHGVTTTLPVNASTHRAIAFASIGVATVGYTIMLF